MSGNDTFQILAWHVNQQTHGVPLVRSSARGCPVEESGLSLLAPQSSKSGNSGQGGCSGQSGCSG